MYILPVLLDPIPGSSLQRIWLFLERNGSHLISLPVAEGQEPAAAAAEFLAVNELSQTAGTAPFCLGNILFVTIDPADKDLASFYSWAEVPPGTTPLKEAWRMFLWSAGGPAAEDPWGVNRLLEGTSISDQGDTVYSALTAYFRAVRP